MIGEHTTVVISCYNKAAYLKDSINSVLVQTTPNWHLIIVDDCSTDGSFDIISSFNKTGNITSIRNEINRGANYCRNLGLSLCSTEYIMFLDADDILTKDCITNRIFQANKNSQANLLVFTMGVFKNKIGDRSDIWLPHVKDPLRNLLSHKLSWSIVQPLWKSSFLKALGGFDLNFKRLQDVELNTRALLHPNLILKVFNEKPDCYYRIDPDRLNYKVDEFMARWIDASIQYVEKYLVLAPIKYRKYLRLTLFQTYLQLIYYKTEGEISNSVFKTLEEKLKTSNSTRQALGNMGWLFDFGGKINLKFKIPGINFLLRRWLTA